MIILVKYNYPHGGKLSNKKTPLIIRLFWKAHRRIYRASGGKKGQGAGGYQNLMFTAIGRKSGLPRDIVISYFIVDNKIVIIGSFLGYDRHPSWYYNLKANPKVKVQLGTETKEMLARITEGDERQHLWNEVAAKEKSYKKLEKMTERRIPVIVFEEIK